VNTRPPSRRVGGTGRDLVSLLGDFGHQLPSRTPPVPADKEPRLFSTLVPRLGFRRPGAGWAAAAPPLSVWRMTSEQTPVLWPFITSNGLPPTGAQMGIDMMSGGAFYCDPLGWVTNDTVPVTNPNVFVFGKPGRGKSGTVKIFCLRMMEFGYRVLILGDVKDEYAPLCAALGVQPFAIGHGQTTRVNPLTVGPLGDGWSDLGRDEARRRATIVFGRWLMLIRGLVGSQKIGGASVPFGPSDETAVAAALRTLTGFHSGATNRPTTWSPSAATTAADTSTTRRG